MPITLQDLTDGSLDLKTIDDFAHLPANEMVTRRLAAPTQPLAYYLDYFHGLELVYSQQSGSVTVNGIQTKTVTQAISDALASKAYKGDTGTAAVISSIAASTLSPGTASTATMGGTPGNRTIALGIPRGDKGASGTITGVTVITGAAGSTASVALTGTPENRAIALTLPRGDKGEVGPAVQLANTFGQSTTQAVSQKLFTDTVTPAFNDIGEPGAISFGVGVTNDLPPGMSQMQGTAIKGHQNWGNYQYSDGSVMCYVPMFYYRWGHADSPRFADYGPNACDVKSMNDFVDVAAANAAGYAVHRAFYDDGKLKDGFFVDKYQCSNNNGTASSIKNGNPLSSSGANNPFSGLTGSPGNNYASAIDSAKTRGADFFPTTVFIQRALSLLSMAHAQAATSSAACAWYDAAGVNNFPKGCNNNALRDVNDTSVLYDATGYSNAGKTGSAQPFAKTTHNGQSSGVADLNGNMYEICLGLTQTDGDFYVLKPSAKAAALTSGKTLDDDAWGMPSMVKNYESLGVSYGELTGEQRSFYVGSTTKQVFSSEFTGAAWLASCAGIPLLGSAGGTNDFGNDRFYDNRVEDMCPILGGYWYYSSRAGVWFVNCNNSRSHSSSYVGCRAALYFA